MASDDRSNPQNGEGEGFCELPLLEPVGQNESVDAFFQRRKSYYEYLRERGKLDNKTIDGAESYKLEFFPYLCRYLRIELQILEFIEKCGQGAAVRYYGAMPRTIISDLAMDLLLDYRLRKQSPDDELVDLLAELLGTSSRIIEFSKNFEERRVAVHIIAQTEPNEFSLRLLAKEIGVNHTTIYRWMKDEAFKNEVKELRKFYKRLPEIEAHFKELKDMRVEALRCNQNRVRNTTD